MKKNIFPYKIIHQYEKKCVMCGAEPFEDPSVQLEDDFFCLECAFKLKILTHYDLTYHGNSYKFFISRNQRFGIDPKTNEIHAINKNQKFWWEHTPETIRRTSIYRSIMKEFKEKHGSECKICKSKHNISIHHIIPIKKLFMEVFTFENTIAVCNPCHRKIHKFDPEPKYKEYIRNIRD